MCCTGSSCSRYSTRTLYTLISNYTGRARYSKVGEHTKTISYVGGTGRPDQGHHLSNKIFRINSQPKYEEDFGLALNKKAPRGTSHQAQAVTYYNANTQKGGLQLAATIRTTREGPQTGTHKAAVPRGHKEETDGGQGGGRYRKRAAAEAAAVT
jgi:hypothetical protein